MNPPMSTDSPMNPPMNTDSDPDDGSSVRRVVGACPLDCPDACSWVVTVDGQGTARQLRGNRDHPFTRGGLCKKVNPWLEYAADSSRLLTPLRRVGPKGSGRFAPVTWTEALDEMAERLLDIRDRSGGEAIWPFTGTGNMGWIQGASGPAGARLFNLLGASQHAGTICSVSGHVGLSYTMGTAAGLDSEDVVHAGVILLWGTNTLVANQHFWPFVEEASANGAVVVVIDPARTRTAERADRYLAPRPGTDGALALGLCRAVRDRDGVNGRFLEARTEGWPEFSRQLDAWSVERAAHICGLDATEIDELAALIVERPPLAVKLGQGMQRHAGGGQTARTVSCLPAMTGAFDEVGGGLLYSTSPAYGLNSFAVQRPDLRPSAVRSLAMTNLGAVLTGPADPPVEALIVSGANPLVSNPQTGLVRQGLGRRDLFTVVIDIYHTETTAFADLVLPSAMQHEQFEMTESFAHLYLNWNEPAVVPPGECLPHTEMYRRLAQTMARTDEAFADPLLQASDLDLAADALSNDAYRGAGITVDRLRREGWVRIPGTETYRPFADRFPTASGSFEFASRRADADGHGIVPTFDPPAEATQSAGSPHQYALVAHASDQHLNSTFAGTERTRSRAAAPLLRLNSEDARRDGFVDGDLVEVGNDRGSFRARVSVGESTRPGVAMTEKGWWGQGVNETVREIDSDMGRGAVFHDNLVVLQRIDGPGPDRPEEAG